MPFPNVPGKYRSKAVLTPQHMLAYRQQAGMLPKGDGPESVILCLQRGLPERMSRRYPFRKVGRINGDLYSLKKTRGQVMVLTNFGLGSPLIAGLAEELIAWGTQRIISISMSGGLQPDLKSGNIVICNRAIRDEGTSQHYLTPAKYVDASPDLVSKLERALKEKSLPVQTGATWTTDATFRETEMEVRQYQGEGVKTVEMESAALFAVAQVRGVLACSAFVVGDSLANGEWRAPYDMSSVERALDEVYGAVIETLSAT